MRRLLIKLVALETALVGWLIYWLFLVYANNPLVSQGLAAQLSKFPQLSFTTVDISVLVTIGVLSIVLALKFQRGLRPGIRLERALQMLENLMKRNLVLEAQVAELKLDKAHVTPSAPSLSGNEPRAGSWERAFRTPLEAGPPAPPPVRSVLPSGDGAFEREGSVVQSAPPRVEPRPVPQINVALKPPPVAAVRLVEKPAAISEKSPDMPATPSSSLSASSWEDSPKYTSETKGIITPSSQSHPQGSVVPESSGMRQPYIPAPPKASPPSVIVGPGVAFPVQSKSSARPVGPPSGFKPVVAGPVLSSVSSAAKPPTSLSPSGPTPAKPSSPVASANDQQPKVVGKTGDDGSGKPPAKPSETVKKRFPYEED